MNEIKSLACLAAVTMSQNIGCYSDETCIELPREIWEHLMWYLHPEDLHRLTHVLKKKGIGCNEVWKKHVKGPFRIRYEKSCKSENGVLLVGHIRSPKYHEAYIIRKVSEILFEQRNLDEKRSKELKNETSNETNSIPCLHKKLMPYSSFLTSLELNSTYCKVLVSDKDAAKSIVGNVLSLKIDFVYQKYYQDLVNLVKLLRCEGNLKCVSFHEMRVESFTDLLFMCSIEYYNNDSHNFHADCRHKRKRHQISGQSNFKKVCCQINADVNVPCKLVKQNERTGFDEAVIAHGDENSYQSSNERHLDQSDLAHVDEGHENSYQSSNLMHLEQTGLAHVDESVKNCFQSSNLMHLEQTGLAHVDGSGENSHECDKDRDYEQTRFDLFDVAFVSKFNGNLSQSSTEKYEEQTGFSYSDESSVSESGENSNKIVTMEYGENSDFDLFDEAVILGDNEVIKQSSVLSKNKLGKADHVLELNCSGRLNAYHDKYNKDPLPSYVQMSKNASWCSTGSPCFQQNPNRIDVESEKNMKSISEEIDQSTNAKHFLLSSIESLHINFSFTGTATQPSPMYTSLTTLMEILPKWKSLQRFGLEFIGHGNYEHVDLTPVVKLIQKKQLTHAIINTNAVGDTFITSIIHTLLLEYGDSQGQGRPMGLLKLEDHSGKPISLPALSGCEVKIQGVSWLILQDMGFQDLSGLHQLIEADFALRHLNLTGCHLHGNDLEKILNSLCSTCVIEELIIDHNHLESNTVDIYATLIKFLQKGTNLKKLHMKYCWIQKELVANPEFIKAIQYHSCLEELALPLNFLGSAATDFLINIFTNGIVPRLHRLDISDNRIEGKHLFSAAARLKQAVKLNPAINRCLLERLDVSCSLVMVQEIDRLRKEFKDIVSDFVVTSKSNSNADFIAQM